MPFVICVARQNLFQSRAEYRVMVSTSASGIHIVGPNKLEKTRKLTYAAHGLVDKVPLPPFHILLFNFHAIAMHLSKHMVAAYVMEPPKSPSIISSTVRNHP